MPSEPAMVKLQTGIAWAIAAVALVLSATLGLMTTYVLAVLVLFGTIALVAGRQKPWVKGTDTVLFAGSFLVIVVLFSLTAKVPSDVLLAVNFIAFLAYAPIARLFDDAHGDGQSLNIAWLALAGVVVAFGICVFQVYGLEARRAQGIFSDTIRFANTTVVAAFIALMGLQSVKAWWRVVFLLAPILAMGVVLLTGTRIAMVAYPIVALVALVLIVPGRWRLLTVIGLALVFAVIGYGLSLEGNARFLSIFDSVRQIFTGERIADRATRIRIELYRGAWQAIQDAPVLGHGWARIMADVLAYLNPEAQRYSRRLVHLHNDLLSMGMAGGIVGIVLYVALLVVPAVLVIISPKDSQKAQRILAIGTLITCYAVMGLTDTMIAFEMNTMLYVVLVAAILRLCRDRVQGAS